MLIALNILARLIKLAFFCGFNNICHDYRINIKWFGYVNNSDVCRKIKKITNSDCKEIHISAKIGEQKKSCLDFRKAKKELNWQPKYNLDTGLKEIVEWFKNNLLY